MAGTAKEVRDERDGAWPSGRRGTSTSGWAAGTSATDGCGERLPGSGEWEEFAATARRAADPRTGSGTRTSSAPSTTAASSACRSGSSTRRRGRWSIYWADSAPPGVLDPPVVGCVRRATSASFEGEDIFEGRPILVRFMWSRRDDADAALGAGVLRRRRQDWETNWVMDFTRREGRDEHRWSREPQSGRLPPRREAGPAGAESITLAGAVLKWYDMARRDAPVPDEIRRWPAHGLAEAARARASLALADDVGFVDPAPLRRATSTSCSSATGATRTRCGRRCWRRTATPTPAFRPWPPTARTGRRSASGSSGWCATSSGRGRDTCARSRDPAALQALPRSGFDGSV